MERARRDIDTDAVGQDLGLAQALAIPGIAHGKVGIVGVEEIENALGAIAFDRPLQLVERLSPAQGCDPDAEDVAMLTVFQSWHDYSEHSACRRAFRLRAPWQSC